MLYGTLVMLDGNLNRNRSQGHRLSLRSIRFPSVPPSFHETNEATLQTKQSRVDSCFRAQTLLTRHEFAGISIINAQGDGE